MESDGHQDAVALPQSAGKTMMGGLGPAFYVCAASHWIWLLMSLQAETLIWNSHFAGDFSTQARVMGNVMSISAVRLAPAPPPASPEARTARR